MSIVLFEAIVFKTRAFIENYFENRKETKIGQIPLVVVGLSGGPDSVFLLYILKEIERERIIRLAAAHLDHGWRKTSSDDVVWCKKLCESLDITFYSEHAQNLERPKDFGSLEALGRHYRRIFFEKLHAQLGDILIALGHHADDQQETFLVRLIRGSSLNGLCCMKVLSDIYFRPLLDISKSFILGYLAEQNISYLIDETNQSVSFLRNRIRLQVTPALRLCDKRFDQKIKTTIHSLQEEDLFLQELTSKAFDKIFSIDKKTGQLKGCLSRFKEEHFVLQKRLIIFWLIKEQVPFASQNSFITEIFKFILSFRGGFHSINQSWGIKKQGQSFWIHRYSNLSSM